MTNIERLQLLQTLVYRLGRASDYAADAGVVPELDIVALNRAKSDARAAMEMLDTLITELDVGTSTVDM
jgi:hypothetical protein